MSMENQVEKEVLEETNDAPERGKVFEKDMYDSMGRPRKYRTLPNDEVFFGSDEEFAGAMQAYNENKN